MYETIVLPIKQILFEGGNNEVNVCVLKTWPDRRGITMLSSVIGSNEWCGGLLMITNCTNFILLIFTYFH